MSFGAKESKSENRELTAPERQDLYRGAIRNLAETCGASSGSGYRPGSYATTGTGSQGINLPSSWGNGGTIPMQQDANGQWVSPSSNGSASGGNTSEWRAMSNDPVNYRDPMSLLLDDVNPNVSMPTGNEGVVGFSLPTYHGSDYQSPGPAVTSRFTDSGPAVAFSYAAPDAAKTLNGGDYDRFEQNIYNARVAPIDNLAKSWSGQLADMMAARGIEGSGVHAKGAVDLLADRIAPLYTQAAGDASTQRYNLQTNELAGLNQNALSRADLANSWGLGNSNMLNSYNLNRANAANDFGQNTSSMLNNYNLNVADKANVFNQAEAQRGYEAQWMPYQFLSGLWGGTKGQVGGSATRERSGGFSF